LIHKIIIQSTRKKKYLKRWLWQEDHRDEDVGVEVVEAEEEAEAVAAEDQGVVEDHRKVSF
jgi:hypothetical protein